MVPLTKNRPHSLCHLQNSPARDGPTFFHQVDNENICIASKRNRQLLRSLSITTVLLFLSVCCSVQSVAKIKAAKNIEN